MPKPNRGGQGAARKEKDKEAWRNSNPKFQLKTESGIYFWENSSLAGEAIDKKEYEKLPKYAKESVLMLNTNGVSTSGWFKTKDGIAYMNTEKSDWMAEVRYHRKDMVSARGFTGDREDYTDDWSL